MSKVVETLEQNSQENGATYTQFTILQTVVSLAWESAISQTDFMI